MSSNLTQPFSEEPKKYLDIEQFMKESFQMLMKITWGEMTLRL
jgi:hypothetical protein